MDDTVIKDTDEAGREPRVASVAAAMAILRHLALHPEGVGVVALARSLGLSPSSCFNVVRTLVSEHFVEFNPKTKIYSLGLGAHIIGRAALDPRAAFHGMKPRLEAFADKCGATVSLLGMRRSDQFVILGFCESISASARIHLTVGQRLPLLVGAAGRCAAVAFDLDDATLERLLKKVKWASQPSLAKYKQSLDHLRTAGWAVDDGDFLHGITTLVSPVADQEGRLQFCVSCTTFSGQHPEDELRAIGEGVAAEARWLSNQLFPDLGALPRLAAKGGRVRAVGASGRKATRARA